MDACVVDQRLHVFASGVKTVDLLIGWGGSEDWGQERHVIHACAHEVKVGVDLLIHELGEGRSGIGGQRIDVAAVMLVVHAHGGAIILGEVACFQVVQTMETVHVAAGHVHRHGHVLLVHGGHWVCERAAVTRRKSNQPLPDVCGDGQVIDGWKEVG